MTKSLKSMFLLPFSICISNKRLIASPIIPVTFYCPTQQLVLLVSDEIPFLSQHSSMVMDRSSSIKRSISVVLRKSRNLHRTGKNKLRTL